ncbi:transcriptional regulator [Nocardia ninae]|uniref:MarR family transcriptional regulator n=1 Tax=Nocardia ninae NBRC 108245 TaxID=1210091 RepID=A0A511MUI2_9NOCA|nr:transcriptional regulator [Nocardia ninae]GEM44250.1 MarR family transcriptional regulator [Nocardia ninae NBRC 108245]
MTARLEPILATSPTRLMVVSYLSGCDRAEFQAVQEYCGLTAPHMSKQATVLADLGYVEIHKGYAGKRPRTWLSLTAAGRTALQGHLSALQEIATNAAAAAAERSG